MSLRKLTSRKGFTLIELMIVVAIIGILAAVAIPKFADLVSKSKEASVKGTLGSLRSAISIYYGDTEGNYPGNLFSALTTNNKYMPSLSGVASLGKYEIPKNSNGNAGHIGGGWANASAAGNVLQDAAFSDATQVLVYFSSASASPAASAGDVYVNCTHQDSKGNLWTSY